MYIYKEDICIILTTINEDDQVSTSTTEIEWGWMWFQLQILWLRLTGVWDSNRNMFPARWQWGHYNHQLHWQEHVFLRFFPWTNLGFLLSGFTLGWKIYSIVNQTPASLSLSLYIYIYIHIYIYLSFVNIYLFNSIYSSISWRVNQRRKPKMAALQKLKIPRKSRVGLVDWLDRMQVEER